MPVTAWYAEKVIILGVVIVSVAFHPYGFKLTAVGGEYSLNTPLSKLYCIMERSLSSEPKSLRDILKKKCCGIKRLKVNGNHVLLC